MNASSRQLGRILIALLIPATSFAQVPHAANPYRAELTRTARMVWGMDAPVATFAAQIHQESAWRPDAVSRVGAQGMAQFMPATTQWIAALYPQSLANAQPFNPAWAMRAMLHYDRWLYQRVTGTDECNRMAFTLSSYNGGLGWAQRDAKLAAAQGRNASQWFNAVELVNAGRSPANWQENRHYPRRILLKHEPIYYAAGWGQGACQS
ncbi:transglycosylase SLT domain-containing protein [Sapientia aquatica]|uniref:Lytic transglycosylase domain-containing protein n=1 Tax=Sapientia aquatica TaxID=1549640 RepID=A0A4R5W1T9_9BURK|nr:transglycosylase SLT domain-containing protein [Sapientia aquatica]TDK65994.1 lytic transglycosylase domain-containing protein [Sapientia aquatica]